MRISDRGSRRRRARVGAQAGFTLIELLVVIAIVALTAGAVTLALRDPTADRLEREAARLSALLEAARAESRASGLAVWWAPAQTDSGSAGFRFVGLPGDAARPQPWLDPEVRAEVAEGAPVGDADAAAGPGDGAAAPALIVLGPEAIIGAQRIALTLGGQRIELATDGLGPFVPAAPRSAAGALRSAPGAATAAAPGAGAPRAMATPARGVA